MFNKNPTSEVIAREIYEFVWVMLERYKFISIKHVIIEETCTTRCKYTEA